MGITAHEDVFFSGNWTELVSHQSAEPSVFGETDELLRAFRDQTGITFPMAWDDGSRDDYAFPQSISPYPRQVLIDRDGTVVHLASAHRPDVLTEAIKVALGLQPKRPNSKLP